MECNRDEAERAKEIAERKFSAKDIAGAKKFVLKAQNLYPGLEGLSQMLATLDVYVAAENKINGESDWYGILGVNPHADDETVRKHYRKLALNLHPDKNKSIGAEGAFKILSEAWSLLSDKARRSAYDQKRNIDVHKQNANSQNGGSSKPPPGSNGFYNLAKSTTSRTKAAPKSNNANVTKGDASSVPSSSIKQDSSVPSSFDKQDHTVASRSKQDPSVLSSSKNQEKKNSFWTVCHQCKMQYEYLRKYLFQNLLCPNCNEPFLALETPPPSGRRAISKGPIKPGASKNGGSGSNHTNFQWGMFSNSAGGAFATQAASIVHQAYEKVKREREEAQAAIKKEEALRRKKARRVSKGTSGLSSDIYSNAAKNGVVNSTGVSGVQIGVSGATSSVHNLSKIEIRLMQKSRIEIQKRLNEWGSMSLSKSPVVEEVSVTVEKSEEKEEEMVNVVSNKESIEPVSIDVPDPDFHDFNRDRTGRCFGENQVWAAYDDDDGMPRYYAMIRKVNSVDPFEARISWLSSNMRYEVSHLNWITCGFAQTCGDFRMGKRETISSLIYFSHKVVWEKGSNDSVLIYPRQGDVWALYRNWSPKWNELTSYEVIHQYDIVEVEDAEEEAGIKVIPLVKVAGFKTVFHRHLDSKKVKLIPREEIFRFSHRIPAYLLTGQEASNAPKGCLELDPAATPLEFLEVKADVVEEETPENELKADVLEEETPENEVKADVEEETPENEVEADVMAEETPETEVKDDVVEEETSENEVEIIQEIVRDTFRDTNKKEGEDKAQKPEEEVIEVLVV